jgi:hypothetical protein
MESHNLPPLSALTGKRVLVIACAFFSSLTLSETSFSFFNRSKMKVEELFEEYSSAGFETEEFEVLESDNSGGKD